MLDEEFYTDLDKTFSYIEALLKQYAKQTNSYLHTPSLVTTRLDKRPTARTVVLRQFDSNSRCLYLFTDTRSKKIQEIQASPIGQLHFYSHEQSIQLRIDCELKILEEETKRKEFWDNTEPHSKLVYQQASTRGEEISKHESRGFNKNDIEKGYEYFAVIQAYIQSIDCLYISPEKHYRSYFKWSEGKCSSSWHVP